MPADDFYHPSDPEAQRRENELLALENRFLRARLSQREVEAGSRWLSVKRARQVDKMEAELKETAEKLRAAIGETTELRRRLREVESEARRIETARAQLAKSWAREARGIARSRSWRLGRTAVRAGRLLTFRRPITPPGGPDKLAGRIAEASRSATPASGGRAR